MSFLVKKYMDKPFAKMYREWSRIVKQRGDLFRKMKNLGLELEQRFGFRTPRPDTTNFIDENGIIRKKVKKFNPANKYPKKWEFFNLDYLFKTDSEILKEIKIYKNSVGMNIWISFKEKTDVHNYELHNKVNRWFKILKDENVFEMQFEKRDAKTIQWLKERKQQELRFIEYFKKMRK